MMGQMMGLNVTLQLSGGPSGLLYEARLWCSVQAEKRLGRRCGLQLRRSVDPTQ